MTITRAVILAGGLGSRLGPLTADRPAALLPVANRPIVEHLLDHLVRHRIREATLALHHHPYPLEARLGDGTRWGMRLAYALERVPLGTAGATRRAAAGWTEPFLVASGTALTTADVSKAAAFHPFGGAVLTLILGPADGAAGEIALDDDGRVDPLAPASDARYRSTGLAIVSPEALAYVPPDGPSDLVADLVPRLLAAGLGVAGYVAAEPGVLVRTPADLLAANRLGLAAELPGLVLPGLEAQRGVRRSHGAFVHPQARVVPPAMIGANAVIGRGAVVEDSVVGDDVIVSGWSVLRRSIVLSGTHVGRGLRVEEAVVDRDHLAPIGLDTWLRVEDPRILGDTRVPLRPHAGS
ncbi:MAG: sugar phosphate nucleotidyltransferase, partial [Candidatus Rokuibacteriota bacterium]